MPEEGRQALTEYVEFLGPMLVAEVQMMQLQIVRKFSDGFGPEAYC